jgi:hypothetical protein
MAQGQQGEAVGEAPETLPGNFFDQQSSAPETLPGDFFEKQKPAGPDLLSQKTLATAHAAAEPQVSTPPIKPQPTGPVSRFAAGAFDAAKAFKPSIPEPSDIALSAFGPFNPIKQIRNMYEGYKRARAAGQPIPSSIAEGAAGTFGINAPGVRERAQRGDIAGIAGEAAVPIAATLSAEPAARAVGAAREAIRPAQQAAAESVVAPLTFEGGGETGADVRSGINPNRALTREPGMAGSKRTLAGTPESPGKISQRVTELKTAANQILDNHQYGDTQLDAGAHIDAAIDNAIARAEKIAGGTERLENLRQALRTKYGATQGTPREMNDLASDIQKGASDLGAFKNTQPIEASAASAMRDAARRIRNNVNEVVPEAAELNSRMADLLDAQSGVTHNLNAERGQSIFGGNREGFWSSALNRTIGSAPVRTRIAQMLNAGNKFAMPDATPTMPAAPFPARGPLPFPPGHQPPIPDAEYAPREELTAGAAPAEPRQLYPGQGPTPFPPGYKPPIPDAETTPGPQRDFEGRVNLPSSGRVIIPSRPPVEVETGRPELPAGPETPKQLSGAAMQKALPAARQIQVGPSNLPPPAPPVPPKPPQAKLDFTQALPAAREAIAAPPPEVAPEPPKPAPKAAEAPKPETAKIPPAPTRSGQAALENPGMLGNIKNPRETANPKGAPTAFSEKAFNAVRAPREQLEKFEPDTLEEAKLEVANMREMWGQFERPGRYIHDENFEPGALSNHRPETVVNAVPSARPSIEAEFPWLKNLPKMTEGKLRAAVESGKGVEYTRLLNEAGKHIQAAKVAAGPVIEEYRAQLEDAAKGVEGVDADLARTLRDVIAGKYSGMSRLRSFIKDRLGDAEAATAFDKAVGDLSAEELSEGTQEPAGQGNQPREEGILPGLEGAVRENRAAAGRLQGEELTKAVRSAGENITEKTGEMETRSPLFRGTEASPQNEMFGPGSPQAKVVERWNHTAKHDERTAALEAAGVEHKKAVPLARKPFSDLTREQQDGVLRQWSR